MPLQNLLQDEGEFQVSLVEDTPLSVLKAIDVRTYAYSTVVVTPGHWSVGDLSDADLLSLARFCGVYLAQTDQRLNLEGSGMVWWLGQENDNGEMYTGVDTTSASLNFADQLDARIFTSFANGLTRGSTNALATARTIKIPGNATRRSLMDTICAAYNSTPFEWRANPDFSIDFDTQANLYATATTPTAILTNEGGRDGAITGLHADLDIATIDVEDYRTRVEARWNEATPGTTNGSATNTPSSTWKAPDGTAPELTTVIDFNPRKGFRERPNKSDRVNASNYGAYYVNALAQANNLATAHANQTNSYALEVTADVDEYDPQRFIAVGDSVWCYDLDLGLVDTANEVYYRGSAIHPQKLRVQAMTTPILEGYGVYLRYWNGASFSLYDLTPYVAWEDDVTTYELGTRSRFHRKNARPRRFNKKRLRRQQARNYRIQQYLQAVSR